jgi:hypothetical protein
MIGIKMRLCVLNVIRHDSLLSLSFSTEPLFQPTPTQRKFIFAEALLSQSNNWQSSTLRLPPSSKHLQKQYHQLYLQLPANLKDQRLQIIFASENAVPRYE